MQGQPPVGGIPGAPKCGPPVAKATPAAPPPPGSKSPPAPPPGIAKASAPPPPAVVEGRNVQRAQPYVPAVKGGPLEGRPPPLTGAELADVLEGVREPEQFIARAVHKCEAVPEPPKAGAIMPLGVKAYTKGAQPAPRVSRAHHHNRRRHHRRRRRERLRRQRYRGTQG